MAPSNLLTPLGEIGCLGNPYFICWLPKHPVFLFALTQSVRLLMVTYPSLCSTCDLRDTMLCHWSPDASHPNPYLGKRRISLGAYFGHMPHIPSLIAWLQFFIYFKFVFIRANIVKILLVVKMLIKNAIFFPVQFLG